MKRSTKHNQDVIAEVVKPDGTRILIFKPETPAADGTLLVEALALIATHLASTPPTTAQDTTRKPCDDDSASGLWSKRLAVKPSEAAEMLSCSRDTIIRMIRDGELQSVGSGRMKRIAVADLQAWVERSRS